MSRGSVALGLRISAGFCAGLPACPGSAAARDLRRAAELQRAADRHRQRPFERLRILAANGLQTPDPNPESISGCGALTPPKHEAWSNPSTASRVGWNSPPPCSPERGSISNAKELCSLPSLGLPGSSENSAGRREKRSPQGWRDSFHGRPLRRSTSCWKWTRTRAYPGSSGSRRTQPSHLQLAGQRPHDRVRCAETLGCLLGQESLLPR